MAEDEDTSSSEQKAVAKGRGSLAINAAQYANVTVYQYVTYAGDRVTVRETTDPSRCPYPGLETFRTSEAEYFAGREGDVAELEAKLRDHNICGVIAASGAGKSSLVNAGLIPALAERETEAWDVFAFKPGQEPLYGLARSMSGVLAEAATRKGQFDEIDATVTDLRETPGRLRRYIADIISRRADAADGKHHRVLIFVDQWEELYTRENDADRDILVRELMDVAERGLAKVLLTMRIDFMDDLVSKSTEFYDVLEPAARILRPLSETGRRAAIEKPAEVAGLGVPPELTSRLVADLGKDEGTLPYLQFVLRQLWEKRDKETNSLTTATYDSMDGLKGAIGTHADDVFRKLSKEEQGLAQRVLPRLANVSDTGITSRRLPFADFDEPARNLLRRLAEPYARLIVLSSATEDVSEAEIVAEVAHEALLDDWKTLSGWIADRKDFFRLRNKLEADAKTWVENDKNREFLIRIGKPLVDAQDLLSKAMPGELGDDLQGQISASLSNSKRRRRAIIGSVTSVMAILLSVILWGVVQTRWAANANLNLAISISKTLSKNGEHAAATRTLLQARPFWSPLTAVFSSEWENALRGTLLAAPEFEIHTAENPQTIELSSDGRTILAWSSEGSMRLWDLQTGHEIGRPIQHDDLVWSGFLPGKHQVISITRQNSILRLWDADTSEPVGPEINIGSIVEGASISPDGKHLALGTWTGNSRSNVTRDEGTLLIYDLQSGQPVFGASHSGSLDTVEYSADGSTILTSNLGRVRMFDARNMNEIPKARSVGGIDGDATLSPDGQLFVATLGSPPIDNALNALLHRRAGTSEDCKSCIARIWDSKTGQLLSSRIEEDSPLNSLQFSPDGSLVLSSSTEGDSALWNVQSGFIHRRLLGHKETIRTAQFNELGTLILTGSDDGSARIWSVASGHQVGTAMIHESAVVSAKFSEYGNRVATLTSNGVIRVWRTDGLAKTLSHYDSGHSTSKVYLRPQTEQVFTISPEGSIRIWDARTGLQYGTTIHHEGTLVSFAASPRGNRVVTGTLAPDPFSENRLVLTRIWDTETGRQIGVNYFQAFLGPTQPSFSLDGHSIAIATLTGDVVAIDLQNGEETGFRLEHFPKSGRHLDERGHFIGAVFGPDDNFILATADDGTVGIWSVQSGQQIRSDILHPRAYLDQPVIAKISPSGEEVVTWSEDSSPVLWGSGNRALNEQPLRYDQPIEDLVYSNQGDLLLVIPKEGMDLWVKVGASRERHSLLQNVSVEFAGFSADGNKVFAMLPNGQAIISTTATGQSIEFGLGRDAVWTNASFNNDGSRLITVTDKKTITVWSSETGHKIGEFDTPANEIIFAEFLTNSDTVLTVSETGQMMLISFKVAKNDLRNRAEALATR